MKKIYLLKELIVNISAEQRKLRPERKASFEGERNFKSPHSWEYDHDFAASRMRKNKRLLRILHVAYCLLRGTPYEKIEPKVDDGHGIDMSEVSKIMEEYRNEETVCAGQV